MQITVVAIRPLKGRFENLLFTKSYICLSILKVLSNELFLKRYREDEFIFGESISFDFLSITYRLVYFRAKLY